MKRCYKKDSSLLTRKFGEKTALLSMHENITALEKIYIINEVGGRIWELIDGKRTVKEIEKKIVEEFDVNPQQAEIDLMSFLKELEKRNDITLKESRNEKEKSAKAKKCLSEATDR